MAEQVGVMSRCIKSLDGLAYTQYGRNLKTWWNFEDFIGGIGVVALSGIWSTFNIGVGASVVDIVGAADRPGIIRLSTGTTAVGTTSIYTGLTAIVPFLFGGGVYTFETDIVVPILSTAIEEFSARFGFGGDLTIPHSNGVYFEYDRTASPNWIICATSAGISTKTDTGIPVVAGVFRKLRIIINALGTSAEFFINGVSVGVITTNLPIVALSSVVHVLKSVGITSRYIEIDWVWLHFDLTVSR